MITNELQTLVGELEANGIIVAEHGLGCLQVRGNDGLDLLQRLSTNDLLSGPVPRAVRTVFTSEKGRAVAEAEVVVTDANVHLIVQRTALGKLREWIERFTILEDISLSDVTDDVVMTWFVGPYSFSSRSLELKIEALAAETRVANAQLSVSWRSALGRIPGTKWLAVRNVVGGFLDTGEQKRRRNVDAASYELLRIAAGVPVYPNEFNGESHPLELGLRDAISFKKGCYVGQEVVARLDAYAKVQRQLVLLAVQRYRDASRMPAEIVSAEIMPAGIIPVEVIAGDQVLGHVTSMSPPLSDGSCLALAICRKGAHTVPGTELLIRAGAQTSAARVRPFLGSELIQSEQS